MTMTWYPRFKAASNPAIRSAATSSGEEDLLDPDPMKCSFGYPVSCTISLPAEPSR